MIDTAEVIINFLINGLRSILSTFITWLYGFFMAIGQTFVDGLMGIINAINGVLPNPGQLLLTFYEMIDIIRPYIGYIVDMTFISSGVITYFVGSFVFRIVARRNTYVIKLLVGWFSKLIP